MNDIQRTIHEESEGDTLRHWLMENATDGEISDIRESVRQQILESQEGTER